MASYNAPKNRVHRGFVYLDNETVINSLSAIESGQIDSIIAKIGQAREGGFGGGMNASFVGVGGNLEAGKKSTSSFEEEVVKTRTNFSIFEAWYQKLKAENALGTFEGWGDFALADVEPGHTVEIRGSLQIVPLQTLFRLFRWFAGQVSDKSSPFAQKGEELQATRAGLKNMETLLGGTDEVLAMLQPLGGEGPTVAVILDNSSLITDLGRFDGVYSVIAQVERVLGEGDIWPTVRLTSDAPVTKLEQDTLNSVISNFVEPAKALGVEITPDEAELHGPALLLRAIAVYR